MPKKKRKEERKMNAVRSLSCVKGGARRARQAAIMAIEMTAQRLDLPSFQLQDESKLAQLVRARDC